MYEETGGHFPGRTYKKCISACVPADGCLWGQLPELPPKRQGRKDMVFLDFTQAARFQGLLEVPDQIMKEVNEKRWT